LKQKWLEYFNGTRKFSDIPEGQRCKKRAKVSLKARRKTEECMRILTIVFRGMDYITKNSEFADIQLAKILNNDMAEEFLKNYNLARRRVVLYIKRKKEKKRRIPRELRRKLMPVYDLVEKKKVGA